MSRIRISATQPRAGGIDRYVGSRMRERRLQLGLSQQELAELLGVTYQQAHKYEKGINRIAAGRLYVIAEALSVPVNYFFDGFNPDKPGPVKESARQRQVLELVQNFMQINDRKLQEAVSALTRVLAGQSAD